MLARLIPTNVHRVLDYLVGLLLIVSPWLFGFADVTAATWLAIIVGAGLIVVSAITDYELSLAKIVPMRAVVVGIAEIGAGLVTEPEAERRRTAGVVG